MRAGVVAVAVLCCLAGPASADGKAPAKTCAMTDPAGDVRLAGVVIDDKQVDLREVGFAVSGTEVVLGIRVVATTKDRFGVWRVTFLSGRTPLYVVGSTGAYVYALDRFAKPGFHAGVVGGKDFVVKGSLTTDVVRIVVPLAAFGKAAPRKGTVLSGFAAEAAEKFVALGDTYVGPSDTASWPYVFTVGGACRPK